MKLFKKDFIIYLSKEKMKESIYNYRSKNESLFHHRLLREEKQYKERLGNDCHDLKRNIYGLKKNKPKLCFQKRQWIT